MHVWKLHVHTHTSTTKFKTVYVHACTVHAAIYMMYACVYSTECVHVNACTRMVMYVGSTGLYLIHREIYPLSLQDWGSFFPICWVWWLMVVSCELAPCLRLMFNSGQEHWPCCIAVVWRALGGAWLNSSNTLPVYVWVCVSLCQCVYVIFEDRYNKIDIWFQ